ncbi:hypothetical protein ACTMTI_42105 [Nonomuraea sp. H19]|uniref:hypothetical protein n=1 Tax=Nonomuraea sp. H19 TaxID=3452206 RepID=UPI003F8884AE
MRLRMIFTLLALYAAIAAEARAKAHPHDLAPQYLLHDPYRVVAPYVTERGRELAGRPVAGIVPLVRRVPKSQADLDAVVIEWEPFGEPMINLSGYGGDGTPHRRRPDYG